MSYLALLVWKEMRFQGARLHFTYTRGSQRLASLALFDRQMAAYAEDSFQ